MKKSKSGRRGVVFSTDPSFDYDHDEFEDQLTLPVSEQKLFVSHDRKQRKGKVVTLVEGFIGREEDLKEIEKMLKRKCGVGGTSKNGEIIIQGAVREKVQKFLQDDGYRVKLKGGQ